MQNEMDKLFRDVSTGLTQRSVTFPAINIWSNDESAIITAEIPGIQKDSLDISVTGDTLSISGSRIPDDVPDDARYHRQERNYGEFSRDIQLPYTVDVEKVKADFALGVLKVTLPRVENEKPKKIAVKAS
jgi:HSP20 family protein